MKKIFLIIMSICILCGIYMQSASMESIEDKVVYENFEAENQILTNHKETLYDPYGNPVNIDFDALEAEVQKELQQKANTPANIGGGDVIEYGVVNFRTKADSTINTLYTNASTGEGGYLNGYYGADGAFLGFNEDATQVKFMMAGVVGWVNATDVEILDYEDEEEVKSVNYYAVLNGKFYHYGTENITLPYYSMKNFIGYKQDYLVEGGIYYSYDGHYFYETFEKMIDDYKANTRENAVNKDTPYYNYYQYLSHRSTTNISAELLDKYTNAVVSKIANGSKSKMLNTATYFVNYERIYGANALLMYSLAAHESGWGLSSISQNKNNLFGHAAYDASAGDSSTGYFSAGKSIYSHAKYFVSEGYLDPKDYSGRYYGPHFGDKASGMNVKYASDPYWGEKAAEFAWTLYDTYKNSNDLYKYTIAIQNDSYNLNVRKETSTSSSVIYKTKNTTHFPFVVLNEVKGESVSGNNIWYKIQSDSTLNSDRTQVTQDCGEYDFDKYYAYIHSSFATIVSKGTNKKPDYDLVIPELPVEEEEEKPEVEPTPKPEPKPEIIYPKGDVNGDLKVTPADYVAIKNHIMKAKVLVDKELARADVNADGKITPADYVAIKNIIMK